MFQVYRARAPSEIDAVIRGLIGPQDTLGLEEFRDVYVAKDDIDFIKAAGFNTVRVPLHWGLFVKPGPRGEDQFEGPGWAVLDRLVGWSREAGLRVILDLHAAPGGQTGVNHDDGPGFYSPVPGRAIELWRRLALHYRDEPTVLAYDLLNEPISPYNDEAYLNPRLEPLYRESSRRSGRGLTRRSSINWSTSFAAFSRPFDDNAIYSYHKFWAVPARDAVQASISAIEVERSLLIGETGKALME